MQRIARFLVLASRLLSKSAKDTTGGVLLKFALWFNPNDKNLIDLKTNLIFQDQIIVLPGIADLESISSKLMKRLETLESPISNRLLYLAIVHKINPNEKTKSLCDENSSFDMTLSKLFQDAEKPEMEDLETITKEEALRKEEMEKENLNTSTVEKQDINQMLDAVRIDHLAYSETSAVHAINTLTQNLFWRGSQVRIDGNRFHYLGTTVSTVGALFYTPPFPLPVTETYTLKKNDSSSNPRPYVNQLKSNVEGSRK